MIKHRSKIGAILIALGSMGLLAYHMPNTGLTTGEQLIFVMQCVTLMLWGLYNP